MTRSIVHTPGRGRSVPLGFGSTCPPGHEVEPAELHHHRHDERRFHKRGVLADAQARATLEREVSEPLLAVVVPGGEALWVEGP